MNKMKNRLFTLVMGLVLGCGDYDSYSDDPDLGQTEQAVGIKVGQAFSYGVTTATAHSQIRCQVGGGSVCSVPRTKAPTYFLTSSMSSTEKSLARTAFNYYNSKTNWVFTETTNSASATILVNNVAGCSGSGIQNLVCINLAQSGNTLSEPTSIPNTYTEHTTGVIHIDNAKINASTSVAQERINRTYHGLLVAIASWMGHGAKANSSSSPVRLNVLNPDTVVDLTAGEICAMKGFLPGAQFGTATSIGIVATCSSD